MKVPPWLVAAPLHGLYRLLCKTMHFQEYHRDRVDAIWHTGQPVVFALWHDELFSVLHVKRDLRLITVVSQSRDGEYLARVLQKLGFETARGSSSRGGSSALLHAARRMQEENLCGCATVDGPRGPRHKAKPGVIFLSQHAHAPLIPVRIFCSRAKYFNSWDRFQVPLPGAQIRVAFGEPYLIEAELDKEGMQEQCRLLEDRLNALESYRNKEFL